MNFDMSEFGKTLRNDVFATWFGWSVIMAIIIFPMTSMVSTCHSDAVKEEIEIAKIEAVHGDKNTLVTETMKWMVARGVHPLVARCALLNSPVNQCAFLINDLEEEERTTIKELLRYPFVEKVLGGEGEIPVLLPPVRAEHYTQGLDFGARSPTE